MVTLFAPATIPANWRAMFAAPKLPKRRTRHPMSVVRQDFAEENWAGPDERRAYPSVCKRLSLHGRSLLLVPSIRLNSFLEPALSTQNPPELGDF